MVNEIPFSDATADVLSSMPGDTSSAVTFAPYNAKYTDDSPIP